MGVRWTKQRGRRKGEVDLVWSLLRVEVRILREGSFLRCTNFGLCPELGKSFDGRYLWARWPGFGMYHLGSRMGFWENYWSLGKKIDICPVLCVDVGIFGWSVQ